MFVWAQPEDNIQIPFCTPGASPAGIFSPAVDDGYYVLLNPSQWASTHPTSQDRFHFISYAPDITYDLTVVPVSTK